MNERILIVEDEADIADLFAYHIREDGFAVEIKGDGLAGLKSIRTRPPNLLVLDLTLPKLSGFDVLRAIKNDTRALEKSLY